MDTTLFNGLQTNWLNKVPAITISFWVIKIMSTTVGETGADFLAVNVGWGPVVTSLVMAGLLVAALVAQLCARRYTPWIYWLTVVLVSVVGTQITDLLTDGLGVSLYASTSVFALALVAIFLVWYWVERTLSIHDIVTLRRELFYWAAVLYTFALGTAAGDLATEVLGLGSTAQVRPTKAIAKRRWRTCLKPSIPCWAKLERGPGVLHPFTFRLSLFPGE
jgi:uncharacterized membrane-anchored protein